MSERSSEIDHRADTTVATNGAVAMIFEFWFDPDRPDIEREYLSESEAVREHLAAIDGFVGVERFRSTADPNKYVAIGFFIDEDAVSRWRTLPAHRRAQRLGRARFFTHYRLRMAQVTRDYDATRRSQAPRDSRTAHDNLEAAWPAEQRAEHVRP